MEDVSITAYIYLGEDAPKETSNAINELGESIGDKIFGYEDFRTYIVQCKF